MKYLLLVMLFISTGLGPASYASEARSVECFFDGGGYDDEFIFLTLVEGGVTEKFKYESYRGVLPGFKKISERVYVHSIESEKIYTAVSFNRDFTKAFMILNYKENGEEFFRQDFICK